MNPGIFHLDHCSVIITDVERSRRFYRDVLGLKEIPKPRTFDFQVLWFDLGNQHLRDHVADTGHRHQPLAFGAKGFEQRPHLLINVGDGLFECVDLPQMQLEKEAVR